MVKLTVRIQQHGQECIQMLSNRLTSQFVGQTHMNKL